MKDHDNDNRFSVSQFTTESEINAARVTSSMEVDFSISKSLNYIREKDMGKKIKVI